MLFRFVALHVTTCSSGVIREKGRAAPGDTVTPSRGGGDTHENLNIFAAEFTRTLDKRSPGKAGGCEW